MSNPQREVSLQSLPPEILAEIVLYLSNLHEDLYNLSLSCHQFNDIIKRVGWKAYVQRFYSDFHIDHDLDDYLKVAHSLATLIKSLQTRAMLAREISPTANVNARNLQDAYQKSIPKGIMAYVTNKTQKMGNPTLIESHERLIKWDEREEVVIWTAGPNLLWRYRVKGAADDGPLNEIGNSKTSWGVVSDPSRLEGVHDYTALKLLGTIHETDHAELGKIPSFSVLAGCAVGGFDLLNIPCAPFSTQATPPNVKLSFETGNNRMIRGIDMIGYRSNDDWTALVTTDDSVVQLFTASSSQPKASLTIVSEESRHQTLEKLWDAKYLSDTSFITASTRGNTKNSSLKLYTITPTGINAKPTREWPQEKGLGGLGSKVILRLASSVASTNPDTCFLVGKTDGSVGLYDSRTSRIQKVFWDSMDDGGVYSLLNKGDECVMVGMDKSTKLKMFDLRRPETPVWQSANVRAQLGRVAKPPYTFGFSVFLTPQRLMVIDKVDSLGRSVFKEKVDYLSYRHAKNSPIYSLSSPSPYSSTIYAGLLSRVVQIDMVNVFDLHPDPIYKKKPFAKPWHTRHFWDPNSAALELSGYDHTMPIRLYQQSHAWTYEKALEGQELEQRWLHYQPKRS